ncbi:MAG: hypothetical protein GY772_24470, partial [bacterium]|nr:hypothetical protein [bacterium]
MQCEDQPEERPPNIWQSAVRGRAGGFDPEHLGNAVRANRHLRSQAASGARTESFLQYLFPGRWEEQLAALADRGFTEPSRYVVERARVRLDVVAMLAQREWHRRQSMETYRYVTYDASPQAGVEIFNSCEVVIPCWAVRGDPSGRVSASNVRRRRLPMVVLGQGRTTVVDKAHAHVHQTFLEYGPDVTSLRAAFKAVRGCLSDMGTEHSIGDVPDCIDAFLNRDARAPAAGESFLFPRALQIPGLQHIIDNAMREAVSRTPWWSEWEAKAKVVCQHVGRQGHRDRLVHVLRTSL